jgi:hypothetical protein
MLRLASALARFITKDPNSPASSAPGSPSPKKSSLKSKPSWRSASVHADGRTHSYRCPFTATNALTVVTKKEIDSYNSTEEIRNTRSTDTLNDNKDCHITNGIKLNRRSLAITLEDRSLSDVDYVSKSKLSWRSPNNSEPTSPETECRRNTAKNAARKSSCTLAIDVYKRRGSAALVRQRLNSLSLISGDKLSSMKEKFGTPEKVMHFFGRCFVKFFSNYG